MQSNSPNPIAVRMSKIVFFIISLSKCQQQYQGQTIFALNRVRFYGTNKLFFKTFPAMQTQLRHKGFYLSKV